MSDRTAATRWVDRAAWRSPGAWTLLLLILGLGLTTDLASKSWSYRVVPDRPVELDRAKLLADLQYDPLRHQPSMSVLPGDWFHLRLVLNPGAVFGIGANQRWFFIMFTIAALSTGVLVFARHTTTRMWVAHVAIGLVLAGGFGNLFDRVLIGRVRDFLHLLPGRRLPFGWTWPGTSNPELMPWVFNLADVMLLAGMVLLLMHLRRRDRQRRTGTILGRDAAIAEAVPVPIPVREPHHSGDHDRE